MTITLLCAGALARPGAQRADIESDPRAHPAAWLPAAQLRNEVRAASRIELPSQFHDGPLARVLRRARVVAQSRLDAAAPPELPDEIWLRERFGLDGTVAACTLAPEGAGAPEVVVRPVHLHLGLDHLVLAPVAALGVMPDEAQALAAAANRWLGEEGLSLSPARPDAWRLQARGEEQARHVVHALGTLQAPSARTASGRNIDAWQPSGDAARRWRQVNNLVQMSWFEHPVNAARESAGLLPINGLWLEGRAGATDKRPFDRIWTTDAAIAGLGRRAGASTTLVELSKVIAGDPRSDAAASGPASTDVASSRTTGGTLIAPGFWHQPVEEGDAPSWLAAWEAFETWFEHAFAALGKTAVIRLVLTGERSTVEVLHEPSDRWKVWRALRLARLVEGAE